jgi:hypothetical protein
VKLGLDTMDWIRCEGLVPNAAAFLCRRNVPWAKAYVRRRLEQALDDYYAGHVLGAVWATGQPVVGTVCDNARLEIKVVEAKR